MINLRIKLIRKGFPSCSGVHCWYDKSPVPVSLTVLVLDCCSHSSASVVGGCSKAVAHRQFYSESKAFPAGSPLNLWKLGLKLGVGDA